MPDWTKEIRRRLAGAGYSPGEEARVVEELAQHLEDRYAELRAGGVGEKEAYRETLSELADEEVLGERMRAARYRSHSERVPLGAAGGAGFFEARWTDFRHSLRLLRHNPLYAAVVVLTLALGIGANTAIFSVVDAILLRPSPFVEADRLVMVWETDRNSGTSHEPASWPDVRDFRDRSRTIPQIGALVSLESTWIEPGGEATRLSALGVTPDLPSLLGIRPLLGGLFNAGQGLEDEPVALISEGLWRGRFNGDPGVLGTTMLLNDQPTTIIGILPAEADLGIPQIHAQADYSAPFGGGAVDVWLAFEPSEEAFPRQTHPFLTIGRLAPGTSMDEAQRELAAVAAELEATYPENAGRGVNLEPFSEVVFGSTRPMLLVLLGAVALVLLVTCANVANLILARTAARRREMAIRAALGARSGRMAIQLFTETLVITAIGAAAGVLLAFVSLRFLIALAPDAIPRIGEATIDLRVLAFTGVVTLLVTIGFGLLPMQQARRTDIRGALQSSQSSRASEGRASRRLRGGLVVSQTALAVALVIGAGLLIRSFGELQRTDPGFRTEGILKADYQLPPSRYPLDFSRWPDISEINNFNAQLLERVAALPGVEAAALAGPHPLDPGITNSFLIVGREGESAELPEIRTRFISPSYQSTLGVPLLAGRRLQESDDARATPVALLNRAAVDRYFAGSEPIGQRLQFWGVPWQVVGVVGDERFLGVERDSEPAIYVPLGQAPQDRATLLVRTSGDPLGPAAGIRSALAELDPQIALYGVEPLANTLARSVGTPRFTATLLTLFGSLAIVLALIGLHGVLSYTVTQRTPEMGIRMALGASPREVLHLIVGEGLRLAALGVLLGTALALAGSHLMAGLLFGVSDTDPLTFIAVASGTLIAAALACWLPARRATSTDPLAVLRAD